MMSECRTGRGPVRYIRYRGGTLVDDPETLRSYALLFDRMVPSEASLAAARALRFQADEIERRIEVAESQTRQAFANGRRLNIR
jgi:hypothetical protein